MTSGEANARRRWWTPRFSLRTLAILVTLVCSYFGAWEATKKWGSTQMNKPPLEIINLREKTIRSRPRSYSQCRSLFLTKNRCPTPRCPHIICGFSGHALGFQSRRNGNGKSKTIHSGPSKMDYQCPTDQLELFFDFTKHPPHRLTARFLIDELFDESL